VAMIVHGIWIYY